LVEFGVGFVVWVYEMLDLAHREFAYAEEACARGDFVAEGATDLG
jgi:hypothetical protein